MRILIKTAEQILIVIFVFFSSRKSGHREKNNDGKGKNFEYVWFCVCMWYGASASVCKFIISGEFHNNLWQF
ncbi:hypothetical protein GLYMA_07G132700v4 [Glycine max]|uniref:Uncharacterized protein n=1 Tax=Glycine max TaxID=3847 RepID=A0A0R0J2T5_SOYBN|nr:hypothetical protein GYH30_018277 [Glycine max]KRH49104.1 hypothetical protein GLYMA_07G132700v4 [Glycine max]